MNDETNEKKISSWGELLTRTVELGLGAAMLTAETAQRVTNDLVQRGQVTREESAGLADRLMELGREQRDALSKMMERTTERILIRMDLARRSDLEKMRQRLVELELKVMGTRVAEEPIRPIAEEDLVSDIE